MSQPIIIAIDGPSASGKGTVAKRLAAHFDFAHLDTGVLYRAVALLVLQAGEDPADPLAAKHIAKALTYEKLQQLAGNPILRVEQTSKAASIIAAIPAVRAALLKFQQDFSLTPANGKKGAVLDGRDIGTVIAPQARVKIYVTASAEIRAERRFKELQKNDPNISYAHILADLKERDARDASRSVAPAKPADDAVLLDTTNMTADEAFAEAVKIAEQKLH
jgi:cytidylate kinase